MIDVRRMGNGPIIGPESHPTLGANIQGPSLIRAPAWLEHPLGRYYLYFADHKGTYIRLAWADDLVGPWTVHGPGTLHLEDSCFLTEPPEASDAEMQELHALYDELFGPGSFASSLARDAVTPHIASPDVHVDDGNRRIVMYFHGLESLGVQVSRVATSRDGISFDARPEVLGTPYMRAFLHDEWTYALTMPGRFFRSRDGLSHFVSGPVLFEPTMRHAAVLVRDRRLYVFWTRVGDAPERILLSTISMAGDWMDWTVDGPPREVLRPEYVWEGTDAPVEASIRSVAEGRVRQLRDPAVFVEDGTVVLAYSVAGESGIALAEVAV